jgi:hypothetical protein
MESKKQYFSDETSNITQNGGMSYLTNLYDKTKPNNTATNDNKTTTTENKTAITTIDNDPNKYINTFFNSISFELQDTIFPYYCDFSDRYTTVKPLFKKNEYDDVDSLCNFIFIKNKLLIDNNLQNYYIPLFQYFSVIETKYKHKYISYNMTDMITTYFINKINSQGTLIRVPFFNGESYFPVSNIDYPLKSNVYDYYKRYINISYNSIYYEGDRIYNKDNYNSGIGTIDIFRSIIKSDIETRKTKMTHLDKYPCFNDCNYTKNEKYDIQLLNNFSICDTKHNPKESGFDPFIEKLDNIIDTLNNLLFTDIFNNLTNKKLYAYIYDSNIYYITSNKITNIDNNIKKNDNITIIDFTRAITQQDKNKKLKYIIELDIIVDKNKFIFVNDIGLNNFSEILISRNIILTCTQIINNSVILFKINNTTPSTEYNKCIITNNEINNNKLKIIDVSLLYKLYSTNTSSTKDEQIHDETKFFELNEINEIDEIPKTVRDITDNNKKLGTNLSKLTLNAEQLVTNTEQLDINTKPDINPEQPIATQSNIKQGGGNKYYDKYLKYKMKYLNLKNKQ